MADFCGQCSRYHFGDDATSDFSYLKDYPKAEPGYGYAELCEGCGPILVDNAGECISPDCLEQGHVKHSQRSTR